jgi:hypothetical protein
MIDETLLPLINIGDDYIVISQLEDPGISFQNIPVLQNRWKVYLGAIIYH